MSEENVEALRAVYAEWGRGNFWTPEIFDPEIELVWAAEVPGLPDGERRGLAALDRSMRSWLEVWDDCTWEAEDFVALGDRVVVPFIARGRGRDSDVAVEARWAHVWTMRDGRAIRLEGFVDRAEALAAAEG